MPNNLHIGNYNFKLEKAVLISIILLLTVSLAFSLFYFGGELNLKPFQSIQSNVSVAFKLRCSSVLEKIIGEAELPVINADEYDGENDTVKLQAALNDVPEEGAIVLISPRVWIAAGLWAKSNTILTGMNGSILKRPENVINPFITFLNVSNFAVLNLTFEGGDTENAYGLMIIDSQKFTIQNNKFYNFKESAVKIITSMNGNSSEFAISDNSFFNCQNVPIHVFGVPSRRTIRIFLVSNNTLINGTENGKIGIAFSADGIIENNKIIGYEHGIATRNVSNITITNNYIVNITNYGIYLGTQIGDHGTDNVKIENNSIKNASIGICRYYGSYPLTNIRVAGNKFIQNRELDILADFPALFLNNIITEAAKLKIMDPAAVFLETKTISGQLVVPGDLNDDLKINIRDVTLVAISFGSKEGYTNWNERADIINDGKIDMKDVSFVAKNFGLITSK